MNSGTREREKAHRLATAQAKMMDCWSCGVYGCSPCHYPTHRGMGSSKAGWDRSEWVPLCAHCHDVLDRRHGVSPAADYARDLLIRRIESRR
jgi:hypothetical protein